MTTATSKSTPTGSPTSSPTIAEKKYAHPDALVSTEWLAEHLNDPKVRILESDEDVLLYNIGHIANAQKLDWHDDLNDSITRDYVDHAAFQELLRRLGVDQSTTVVLYGDKSNWWATYAFWVFRLFDFPNDKLRILDGGRNKWVAENRPLVTEIPQFVTTSYVAPERNDTRIRAFKEQVLAQLPKTTPIVDVRSPDEYSGKTTHMAAYPQEGVLRGGHIPRAKSVPWSRAANPDGSFKSADELRAIYEKEQGLKPSDDVITYCRIGERSSHTWFTLTYLLGYKTVRNYDGSWTEWGNSVRTPIER